MKKLIILLLLLAISITVFTGCGGSSGPAPVVVTYNSDIDGIVFSNPLRLNLDGETMGVGDNASNELMQALVSFPLTLPAGASIQTAVLRLYNCDFPGTPFPSNILVEHLHIDFGAIDANDYAGNPGGLTSCGEFSSLIMPGWNELDVTASVQEDYTAPRGKSQFRLYRITLSDNDFDFDSNSFYTSEKETPYMPELVITYTL